MKMQKYNFSKYLAVAISIVFFGVTAAGYAQVNQNELEQDLPPVTFINYEGPHSRVDTKEQIRQTGVGLGPAASNKEGRSGTTNRYYVIHSVTEQEKNKMDADVMGLGVDVAVDHVRNLRVIIQGYLQAAYSYAEKDAALLAEYITIYNAVYRGNWDYFESRYKAPVVENLVREKTGLSIRYDEWPGNTLLVIPLGHGGLSSIDTSAISDNRVVEEMRKEEDKGVEQRRDMVDLKEREASQAEQKARTEREAIKEEEKKVVQEKQEIAKERQKTQEDRQSGKITEQEAQKKERELEKQEQAVEEKEQKIEERREETKKLEEFAEKKTQEAQEDRKTVAKDQQTAIVKETTSGNVGIMLDKQNAAMGRIVLIDNDGNETKRSPLNTVRIRTINVVGGKIIAVAGENKGNGAIRLIEINQATLEMARQGDDDIQTNSLLWVNGSDIYAITIDLSDNSCYLGRFNSNLILQAKSEVKVNPNASVAVLQGRLLTQGEDGSVLMLDPASLVYKK